MNTALQPTADRILVTTIAPTAKESPIIIPEQARERPQEAEVVAVGPGLRNRMGVLIPVCVKPGDRVIIAKWGGTEIKENGRPLLLMGEADVLAIRKDSNATAEVA